MRMGYGLHMEQTQKLIMTPELRQAITVLQLSSLELSMYIEQQLQENPLLELKDDSQDNDGTNGDQVEEVNEPETPGEFDIDWQEYFHDSSDLGIPKAEKVADQLEYSYENFVRQVPTLSEHLMLQLSLSRCGPREKLIGEYLIGNIDSHGYLQVTVEDASVSLGVAMEEVERVLSIIQTFDPMGVGARSLEECLLIQADQMGLNNSLVRQVIKDHLVDLAKGKIGKMAQVLGVTVQEVQRVADIIKTLDPKPGRNFGSPNDTRYITPDVVLEKVGSDYIILINDNSVPRITINSAYRAVLNKNADTKTRRFVESKLNAAAWLLRSIEQRRLTLYKVANCLVELQRDFLDRGVKYLKPLNLKKVADIVGLHESTVSRATSNKYIQTPQGVLEMKYFFSSGLSSTAGSSVSAESIKKMLQEIVAAEDVKDPYNDQKIAEILKRRDINISRRTVAKYRDELGIAPIRKRRRY
ncbi:MAG: DNA-directed RNA polymerase subunit sigma-24 [Peptococcaceae bacterium BICA1-7]|nr:MAG: DNA-directed RNA polymerase subunit sigma-24 [Peptococcaceae bacterium BICA1-7]HBV99091.1 RNA polymerase sigma-54 factor [Desulfotomaculum sp.]